MAAKLDELIRLRAPHAGNHLLTNAVVAPSTATAVRVMLQCAGLGTIAPNIMMMHWPIAWRDLPEVASAEMVQIVDDTALAGKALIIVTKPENFPSVSDGNKASGLGRARPLGALSRWSPAPLAHAVCSSRPLKNVSAGSPPPLPFFSPLLSLRGWTSTGSWRTAASCCSSPRWAGGGVNECRRAGRWTATAARASFEEGTNAVGHVGI